MDEYCVKKWFTCPLIYAKKVWLICFEETLKFDEKRFLAGKKKFEFLKNFKDHIELLSPIIKFECYFKGNKKNKFMGLKIIWIRINNYRFKEFFYVLILPFFASVFFISLKNYIILLNNSYFKDDSESCEFTHVIKNMAKKFKITGNNYFYSLMMLSCFFF